MSAGKVYCAGPMRGYPGFNFPTFDSLSAYLRRHGHEVANPAEHDREQYPAMAQWPGFVDGNVARCPEFSLESAMRWDLGQITTCDSLVLLPGWEHSTGARHELDVANWCGVEVLYAYPSRGTDWLVSDTYLDDTKVAI